VLVQELLEKKFRYCVLSFTNLTSGDFLAIVVDMMHGTVRTGLGR
jgi:hypothetical protein